MKRIAIFAGLFTSLVLAASAGSSPATPAFDRGLPTANLNSAAGANRSNATWSNGNDYVTGDDFTIGSAGQTWYVSKIRTWTVPNDTGAPTFRFGDEYSDVTLYFGAGAISPIVTGTINSGSSVNNNPNIALTRVTYAGGADYQGNSTTFYKLWEVDFKNLGLVASGGQKYHFAVDGTVTDTSDYWFNHASNATLSGSTQQGADDRFIAWSKADLATPNMCNSTGSPSGVCDGGSDKPSDINVQVFASQVATDKHSCKKDWKSLVRSDGSTFSNEEACESYLEKHGK